jgi:hypothetical protein
MPMLDASDPTRQRDEHMDNETKQSSPPTGSVVIGEAQNWGVDEKYDDWYQCPNCKEKRDIARHHNFCPNCGVKLQWEDDDADA